MKQKTKVLFGATLTTAMCASLIAGTTYALFTSESEVNVAITSAKLAVTANVKNLQTGFDGDYVSKASATADFNETTKMLTVENMAPGDKVTFQVNVSAAATIDFQYRLKFGFESENEDLFRQLLIGVGDPAEEGAEVAYDYYSEGVTAWMKHAATGKDAVTVETKEVVVEMPYYVSGEQYMGKTCKFAFAVEAVQGNANKNDEASALKTHVVKTDDELNTALGEIKDGETLVLWGNHWENETVKVESETLTKLYVNGDKVGTFEVNAPNADVKYYNAYTNVIQAKAVADNSLHIFGKAEELVLNQGKAVIESGANLNAITLDVAENASAKLVIAKDAQVENVAQAEGSAGEVEFSVSTAEGLKSALMGGGKIVLTENITVADQLQVTKPTEFDLNGMELVGTYAGAFIVNAKDNALTFDGDGHVYTTNIDAQKRASVLNYGTLTINENAGTFGSNKSRGNAVNNFGNALIKGGKFTACDNYTNGGYAYALVNGTNENDDAVMTIENATVFGKMNGVLAADGGKLIVNGGTYTLGTGEEDNLFYMAYTSGAGVIEINGGKFTRNAKNNHGFFAGFGSGNITVKGGEFEDLVNNSITVSGYAPVIITEGYSGTATFKQGTNANVVDLRNDTQRIVNVKTSAELISALKNAKSGDVIMLAEGTYSPTANEEFVIKADNVILLGADLKKTILDAKEFTCSGQAGFIVAGNNVTVQNVTIKTSSTSGDVAALKVTNLDAVPEGGDNKVVEGFRLQMAQIFGNEGHGVNLHTVKNAVLYSLDILSFKKVGVSLAEAQNVTISGVTTYLQESCWADLAIMYKANNVAYNTPSDVTINNISEFKNGRMYSERPESATLDKIKINSDNKENKTWTEGVYVAQKEQYWWVRNAD